MAHEFMWSSMVVGRFQNQGISSVTHRENQVDMTGP
jgi:hypothetical protein